MATDSFTAANGTDISAHTAGGNTWAGMGGGAALGTINDGQLGFGEGFGVAARASNSSSDYSQVVLKGGNYVGATKAVHVRSNASNDGYELRIGSITTDTVTSLHLWKNNASFLSGVTVSFSRLTDHTLAIKAIPSGSDVQLKGYVDGTEVTFQETGTTTFTDVAANSPLAAGNPAISVKFEDGMNDANSRLDDWTDVDPSGAGTKPRPRGMDSGFVDLCGGLE